MSGRVEAIDSSVAVVPGVPVAPPALRRSVDATVAAAQAGDTDAFRVLYDAHAGRVYALCLRLLADAAWAEELTQDVFVRAWRRLESFRGESAFGTWLHRLAVNEVMMAFRAVRRHERRRSPEPPGDVPAAIRSPELALDLERAIAGLPAGCRTVFVLHDVEGWRHEEIAAMTGTAVGTSRAHLFRARRLLRAALER
jgi:RNA polymerase sigma-70 factor (ECF subfamily)